MCQSGATDTVCPPTPGGKEAPTAGWAPRQPTLAGDRVRSQDLVLGTGTLAAPGGGQAQAAAAAVVYAALVGAHCGGKAGVRRRGLQCSGNPADPRGAAGHPQPPGLPLQGPQWEPGWRPQFTRPCKALVIPHQLETHLSDRARQ